MKFLNAFFIGFLLVAGVCFALFVGLKTGYFDYYGVDEYFNVIFADCMPWIVVLPLGFVLGYAVLYSPFRKILSFIYALCLLGCLASWNDEFGRKIGERLFMKSTILRDLNANEIRVFEIYKSRDRIYYFDKNLNKNFNRKI